MLQLTEDSLRVFLPTLMQGDDFIYPTVTPNIVPATTIAVDLHQTQSNLEPHFVMLYGKDIAGFTAPLIDFYQNRYGGSSSSYGNWQCYARCPSGTSIKTGIIVDCWYQFAINAGATISTYYLLEK